MTLNSRLFIILIINSNYQSLDAMLAFFGINRGYYTIYAGKYY